MEGDLPECLTIGKGPCANLLASASLLKHQSNNMRIISLFFIPAIEQIRRDSLDLGAYVHGDSICLLSSAGESGAFAVKIRHAHRIKINRIKIITFRESVFAHGRQFIGEADTGNRRISEASVIGNTHHGNAVHRGGDGQLGGYAAIHEQIGDLIFENGVYCPILVIKALYVQEIALAVRQVIRHVSGQAISSKADGNDIIGKSISTDTCHPFGQKNIGQGCTAGKGMIPNALKTLGQINGLRKDAILEGTVTDFDATAVFLKDESYDLMGLERITVGEQIGGDPFHACVNGYNDTLSGSTGVRKDSGILPEIIQLGCFVHDLL